MKTNTRQKMITGSLIASMMLFSFQNCSQNGSIQLESPVQSASNAATGGSGGDDGGGLSNQYQDHSKTITALDSNNKVDVLVVIDNSGSMAFEQTNMSQRFGTFLDELHGLDWQVGIVTTDVTQNASATTDGKLLEYVSAKKMLITSADDITLAKSNFASTIQRSERGSGNEQGIKASLRALQRAKIASDPNSALLRANAALSIIVVTDANEMGTTLQNSGDNLHDYITTNYPGKSFKFNSIIVKENDSTCLQDRSYGTKPDGTSFQNMNEGYGSAYTKISNKTSGIIGSVCQQDYGSQLTLIGQKTAEQIRQTTLDCEPVDADSNGHLDVEIRDKQTNTLITNYIISGLQIKFDQPLAAGDYVISYKCLAK